MAGMILQAQWDTEHIKEKKWVEEKHIRNGHKELNLTLTAKTEQGKRDNIRMRNRKIERVNLYRSADAVWLSEWWIIYHVKTRRPYTPAPSINIRTSVYSFKV